MIFRDTKTANLIYTDLRIGFLMHHLWWLIPQIGIRFWR